MAGQFLDEKTLGIHAAELSAPSNFALQQTPHGRECTLPLRCEKVGRFQGTVGHKL